MMITERAVMGPFVTEQSTVGPYTVLVFDSPLPQKRAGCPGPLDISTCVARASKVDRLRSGFRGTP